MISKLKIFILSFALAFSVFSAAADDVSGKIIGGTEAASGSYPFMVALLDTSKGSSQLVQQFCGGTLIGSQWVVTAAHCAEGYTSALTKGRLRVLYNTNYLSDTTIPNGTSVAVSAVYIHENYNSVTYNNDIALLRIASPATVSPIARLSTTANAGFTDGTLARVIGWGSLAYPVTPHTYSTDLMQVDVPVVSNTICGQVDKYSNLTANMLCAGYAQGGKDSCSGDSGGPLFVTEGSGQALIGIVSNGYECAQPGYYGIYTRVANYGTWLSSKMNSYNNDDYTINTDNISTTGGASEVDASKNDETLFTVSSSQLIGVALVGSTFSSYSVSSQSSTIENSSVIASVNFTSTLQSGNSTVVALYLPDLDLASVNLYKCQSGMSNCSALSVRKDYTNSLVWYYVQDGGTYDSDGVANGIIVDPVYIGVDGSGSGSGGGGGGGGCSAAKDGSPAALLLMFAVGGIYLIRRRRA
jgi:uncharacterized protein (TIGR03382 family)